VRIDASELPALTQALLDQGLEEEKIRAVMGEISSVTYAKTSRRSSPLHLRGWGLPPGMDAFRKYGHFAGIEARIGGSEDSMPGPL